MNNVLITAIISLTFLVPSVAPPYSHAQSSQTIDVNVKNFPGSQQVKGAVTIEGTTSHSKYIKREAILVPPGRRNEEPELTYAGFVETDGFTSISMNLQGEIKSGSFLSGTIGVLLIPDEEPVLRSLREAKRVAFPLETTAELKSGDSTFFDSAASLQRIAFPRYRLFLYNTVNKSVEANVYLYLSN